MVKGGLSNLCGKWTFKWSHSDAPRHHLNITSTCSQHITLTQVRCVGYILRWCLGVSLCDHLNVHFPHTSTRPGQYWLPHVDFYRLPLSIDHHHVFRARGAGRCVICSVIHVAGDVPCCAGLWSTVVNIYFEVAITNELFVSN